MLCFVFFISGCEDPLLLFVLPPHHVLSRWTRCPFERRYLSLVVLYAQPGLNPRAAPLFHPFSVPSTLKVWWPDDLTHLAWGPPLVVGVGRLHDNQIRGCPLTINLRPSAP